MTCSNSAPITILGNRQRPVPKVPYLLLFFVLNSCLLIICVFLEFYEVSFRLVYLPIGQNSFQIWRLSLPRSATFPISTVKEKNSRNILLPFLVGVKRLFFISSISLPGKYYSNGLSGTPGW